MPNIADMDPSIIIAELDEFSRRTGLKQTTVCQNALGNARFYERMKRRVAKYAEECAVLRAYMAANSPPETSPQKDVA